MLFVSDLSRIIHDAIFPGPSQSLCARAHAMHRTSTFWAVWRRVFGPRHCERSFNYHRSRNE
jgi:hypothetical protein